MRAICLLTTLFISGRFLPPHTRPDAVNDEPADFLVGHVLLLEFGHLTIGHSDSGSTVQMSQTYAIYDAKVNYFAPWSLNGYRV